MFKVGIILNYKSAERKKSELVSLSKQPWVRNINLDDYSDLLFKKKGMYHAPADVAIGLYILGNYSDVEIDFIKPKEISTSRFKKNNIVIVLIHDLIESFHLSNTTQHKKYKMVLKNSINVYPPYEFQKFVNNKCDYYSYLEKKGIPVAPTYCVNKTKWYSRNGKEYSSKLINKFINNKWESVIAKPVYGQEGIDFKKFSNLKNRRNVGLLRKYLNKNVPKYKSIVIQEFIKNFDSKNPEFRMYYLNGKFRYSIVTTDSGVYNINKARKKFKIGNAKWNYLKKLSQKVVNVLPKLTVNKKKLNKVLIRVDIGSGMESSKYSYFVNEVEFVPSLYIEEVVNIDVVKVLAEAFIDNFKYYSKKSNRINTIF